MAGHNVFDGLDAFWVCLDVEEEDVGLNRKVKGAAGVFALEDAAAGFGFWISQWASILAEKCDASCLP